MKGNKNDITIQELPAPTIDGVKAFLASPFIDGIGKVYANRIVDALGTDTISKILKNDESQLEINGVGEAKIHQLYESLHKLKFPWELLVFLYSTTLSDSDIEKILEHYKGLTGKVILHDPYQMVEDVWKFSFFSADKIGKAMGIPDDDSRRIRGALLTSIKICAENGHVFAKENEAIELASRITGVSKSKILPEINVLVDEGRIIKSRNGLYLPVYYKAEKEAADKLAEIVNSEGITSDTGLLPTTDRFGRPLSSEQLDAIATVMRHPVTVITGGPGTGKTTAVRGIIEILESQGKKIILAAPTGRAAKRMSDLTGMDARTIHRLLGYRPGEGYKNKWLDADILIIDEASMLEQVLFNHLLQALRHGTKIVLVGDINQLPPIGAGDVLKELISSGTLPVVRLTENFRQKNGSMIATNANIIREGDRPEGKTGSDFEIISEDTTQKIHDRVLELVAKSIPETEHVDAKDVQVVTPQQEGPLGAKQLNIDIQQRVNPTGPEIRKGMKIFRIGDRVMQTSNSTQKDTYNGETGWISDIEETAGTLQVTFYDGKRRTYTRSELGELSLAYATTVHKLQGCETDYMVMPVTTGHRQLLYRNLLYTAVSRARKLCVLVGEDKAIDLAVSNDLPIKRNSNFRDRLRDRIGAA